MHRFIMTAFLALGLGLSGPVLAEDWALTPEKTYERVQAEGDELLFIDVRDPVEIMFVGFTDVVHANIPFRMVDTDGWMEQNNHFAMPINDDFADAVGRALEERGLPEDATIITMCRSGSDRGEPSAEYLRDAGFPNVFYVENGFQGDPASEGEHEGQRVVNGWQNSGLPWSTDMNRDKIYQAP